VGLHKTKTRFRRATPDFSRCQREAEDRYVTPTHICPRIAPDTESPSSLPLRLFRLFFESIPSPHLRTPSARLHHAYVPSAPIPHRSLLWGLARFQARCLDQIRCHLLEW